MGRRHLLTVGLIVNFTQFGIAIDNHGNGWSEQFLDIAQRGTGIFGNVVQVARANRFRIHLEVGQDTSNLNRVDNVWLT